MGGKCFLGVEGFCSAFFRLWGVSGAGLGVSGLMLKGFRV